jgi:exodeoxyribonuclease VII large subunit
MSGFFDVQEELARQARAAEAPERPVAERAPPMSVSDLTRGIKAAIKGAYPATVSVRGEISNFRGANQSGHIYFRLKDPTAVIEAVIFAGAAKNLKFKLNEGLDVIARGRVDLFEAGGKYNLIITSLEPVGTGALELAFRQLKAKLETEGLFAPERKKPIPPYPRTIALLTSPKAAGLQDQLKVLRRFPFLRLILVPIPVQGEGAGPRIANAIDWVSQHHESIGAVDLILLGRGGGSLEDLFEFSREEVARAVARCAVPIITGIGHEVDTSIADLVADHHAHTPTEAATYAVRMWIAAAEFVEASAQRLRREVGMTLADSRRRLDQAGRHAFIARPAEWIEGRHQRVDDREHRLSRGEQAHLGRLRRRLDALEQRLSKHDPRRVLLARRERLFKARERLLAAMSGRFRVMDSRLGTALTRLTRRSPQQRLALLESRLTAHDARLRQALAAGLRSRLTALDAAAAQLRVLGPDSVLSRGYSLTLSKATGKLIASPADVAEGDTLITRLAAGQIESEVTSTSPNTKPS